MEQRVKKVLFVCTGNTCRSPMCEGWLRSLCARAGRRDVEVSSAGVFAAEGCPASDYAGDVLRRRGADISGHRSSRLSPEKAEGADLIVALTESHRAAIARACPGAAAKTRLLMEFSARGTGDVFDPVGGDLHEYEACFEEMRPALENLFLDLDKTIADINKTEGIGK